MTPVFQDLRYAARTLSKSPGFSAAVLLTLAIGIGANVAIFSVANGVLFRPLPFRDPDRLMRIGHVRPDSAPAGASFSPQDFEDFAAVHPGLESLGAWAYFPNLSGANLTGAGEPERLATAMVSGGFFPTLGMPAEIGRTLGPDDDRAGKNQVVVLSHSLWQRRFSGDPGVVGRPIELDGKPVTVAGVMPLSFELPAAEIDAWLPLSTLGDSQIPHIRSLRWLSVVGRLGPGGTAESARAGAGALFARLAAQYPDSNAGFDRALVQPLAASLTGEVRTPILVLLGAVSLVLLIACVNVANLMLVRASTRRRELAIRAALGASRSRIVRQLLTESLALSLSGGAAGLLLARWGIDLLLAEAAGRIPRVGDVRMDGAILVFALLLSVATGVVFGLLPAFQAVRGGLRSSIESGGGRSGTGGRGGRRLGRGLVMAEVVLAVALVFGAGLLLRSFWQLTHAESGMKPDSVLEFSITIRDARFATSDGAAAAAAYRSAILSRIRALPGVVAAGGSKTLPLHGGGEPYEFRVDGRPESIAPAAGTFIVTPGYFAALGIPVLRGRGFTEADLQAGAKVLLVNAALANQLFGNADPVGKRLGFGDTASFEVVGVVGNVRHAGLSATPGGAAYVPISLFPRSTLKIFVRTSGADAGLPAAIRAAIRGLDADQPVSRIVPLNDVVSETVARPRLTTLLVAVFGAAALLLAALGIYGVIAYGVAQRTREIGIRIALGADRSVVRRLILGEGIALAAGGIGVGLAVALALARTLRSLLYEVGVADPATLAAVAGLLFGMALLACAIPAQRAARVSPTVALRNEP